MSSSVPTLYRALLRTANFFDANAGLKAMVQRPRNPQAVVDKLIDSYIDKFLKGQPHYRGTGSLISFVKWAFKNNASDIAKAHGQLLRVDAGAACLRYLTTIAAEVTNAAHFDEFRIPALGGELGTLQLATETTPGTLWLEHPVRVCPGRSVVLVFDIVQNVESIHGNEDWNVCGFWINRPLPYRVCDIWPQMDMGALNESPVFQGGVDAEELYIVHIVPDVNNAVPLGETGLYAGGDISHINTLITEGQASVDQFKVFYGSCKWGVEKETMAIDDQGAFFPCSGSMVKELTMIHPVYHPDAENDDGTLDIPDDTEEYNHRKFFHQNVVWAAACKALGGDFEYMADIHPAIAEVLDDVAPCENLPAPPVHEAVVRRQLEEYERAMAAREEFAAGDVVEEGKEGTVIEGEFSAPSTKTKEE